MSPAGRKIVVMYPGIKPGFGLPRGTRQLIGHLNLIIREGLSYKPSRCYCTYDSYSFNQLHKYDIRNLCSPC